MGSQRESSFAELAAKFAAHGGGHISADLSGELALDIVLNEIVEQACLATGASGAAIALARDSEMVCRASTGGNAPDLGTRLDMASGLSGACLRSREIQRCDDTLTHPSADPEVSRQLGVRSVVVLPLLKDESLIGIFEVFSPRLAAFGERDLRTLEVLTDRILRNIRASQSSLVSAGSPMPDSVLQTSQKIPENEISESEINEIEEQIESATAAVRIATSVENFVPQAEPETPKVMPAPAPRFDWFGALMAVIIIAIALLMGTAFAIRMRWLKATGHRRGPRVVSAAAVSPIVKSTTGGPANTSVAESKTPANGQNKSAADQPKSSPQSSGFLEGTLRVFEKGKEIFRMPPTSADADTSSSPAKKTANTDSTFQQAKIVELSADAAEGSLVRRVEPEYPERALAERVQGPVVLDVRIGQDGTVQEIKVQSGEPQLAEAATAAVRQWKFKPHIVDGRAVEMETRLTLTFTLPSS
jgi:TonB family protein